MFWLDTGVAKHAPLAVKAGAAPAMPDALAAGARPKTLANDEEVALDFAVELIRRHGVGDATYAEAVQLFGEHGVVELTVLVGYFMMVCWVMNVARIPEPAGAETPGLTGFHS